MDTDALQFFLPVFMIVFFGLVSVWARVRKAKKVKTIGPPDDAFLTRVRFADSLFRVLLVISISIAVLYSYFPEYYYLTGPIDALDHPLINAVGVLILKVSLFWIVLAQFNIERTIALLNSGIERKSYNWLISYSEKLILTGMLIMFLGLFVTISSVVAIVVCLVAVITFELILKRKHEDD